MSINNNEILDEHVIKQNETLNKNKAIVDYIKNINFDNLDLESVDIGKELSAITSKLELQNKTNLKTFEESTMTSLLANPPKQSYNYAHSDTFDFLAEHDLIRNGFYVVAGDSSSGKTTFASQFALDLLSNNKNTVLLIYSMDDSITFLMSKMIKQILDENLELSSRVSQIEPRHSNQLYKYQEHISRELTDRIHIYENLNVFDNYSTESIDKNIAFVRNEHSKTIDDLQIIVVIDYLQVIDAQGKEIRTALNEACKQLKNIQKKYDCMMLSLSQLSNEGNFRETSEIRNIADIIIKQYSEAEYWEKRRKKKASVQAPTYNMKMNFLFSIEKNKAGAKGMMYKAFINSNYNFYDFRDFDVKKASQKRNIDCCEPETIEIRHKPAIRI